MKLYLFCNSMHFFVDLVPYQNVRVVTAQFSLVIFNIYSK